MNSTDEILAKADATLTRVTSPPKMSARIRAAQRRSAARKAKRIFATVLAIFIAMFIIGLILPIGTTGVMIGVLLMVLASIGIVMMPGAEPFPDAAALPTAALAQLPLKTESWLASQRPMLPAPAQRLADDIGVRLETLAPQLQTLNENEPAAAAIRRLIADELPELVRGYGRVPENLRRANTDGLIPEKQLVDGLSVVDSELARMSEQLARGDLEKLATQGKYLELKYQGDPLG
jgi:hypothetical protein